MNRLFVLTLWFAAISLQAQPDTMLIFNSEAQLLDTLLPQTFDTTVTSIRTPPSTGSLPEIINLPDTAPTSNLFSGTQFSKPQIAAPFFEASSYPARTIVKVQGYSGTDTTDVCSGTLVGDRWVLLIAHCFYQNGWMFDSIKVFPAFDDGMPQTSISSVGVEKYYMFQSFFQRGDEFQALLELKEPIGMELGWMGISFEEDSAFYTNNISHKLSYVSSPPPWDPDIQYNGDTLYYNYGRIEWLNSAPDLGDLGVNSQDAIGLPGQLGSSLFYTNSMDSTKAYVLALSTYAASYRQLRFTREVFFRLKHVISGLVSAVPDPVLGELNIFPNPMEERSILQLSNPEGQSHELFLYNLKGQLIRKWENIQEEQVEIDRGNLVRGVYLLQLQRQGMLVGNGKLQVD